MFSNLSEKLENAFKKFKNKGKLTEADVKEGMREVKLALLEADVNFKVVKDFVKIVTDRAVGSEVMESLMPGQQVIKIVNEELTRLMGGSQAKLEISSKPPTVIMMVGLQGAGKTTHAGKLAGMYKKQGKRPLLVACDVYRPAAIKQLEVLGQQLDVPVFQMGDKEDPVKIAAEGVKYAEQKGYAFRVPLDEIFDLMVLEYSFAFWQWGDDPASVPEADASAEDLYRSLIEKSEPSYFAEQTPYTPFNVQAMREIGYYGYDVRPFEGLLSRPTYEGYMRRVMIPEPLRYLEFKGDLYERCCAFLREQDIPAMFIYGECDPWSATRVVLPCEKENMHVFIQPGGSHRTRVATMPDDMKQQILDILHAWAE